MIFLLLTVLKIIGKEFPDLL